MKRSRIARLSAAALAFACAGAAAGPGVDTALLLSDVRTLSSEQFAGRGTGSEGSRLAQSWLAQRFDQLGLRPFGSGYAMPFSFTHTTIRGLAGAGKSFRKKYPSAANLVGYIAGSRNPGRYLVVSAHYDHLGVRNGVVYPGADDNASGVASMLAIAAYFSEHPPQNSIVFAAFDAEELGLRGAEAFMKALPFPRAQLAMNMNLDMVSRNDNNEIWVAGVFESPALKALVADAAARSTVKLKMGHDRPQLFAATVEDWTSSSDHGPFQVAGVPFLYFGVEDHPDYHEPGDKFEKIDPGFYGRVTSLLVDVAVTADLRLQSVR